MKKLFLFPVNPKLFDEEPEGEEVANSIPDTDLPEDSIDFMGADDDEPEVIYGLQDDAGKGDDNSSNTQEQDEEEKPIVFKSQKEFDSMMGKRLSKYRTIEEQANKLNPLVEGLKLKYGTDNIEEIYAKIEEERIEKLAEEEDISFDTAKKIYKQERELSNYKAQDSQKEKQQRIDSYFAEEKKIQEVYPDFQLLTEIENDEFLDLLNKGVDMLKAYRTVHHDELLQKATTTAKNNTISTIQAGKKKIAENGTKARSGVIHKADVSKLTDKDIDRINEMVRRGAEVKF